MCSSSILIPDNKIVYYNNVKEAVSGGLAIQVTGRYWSFDFGRRLPNSKFPHRIKLKTKWNGTSADQRSQQRELKRGEQEHEATALDFLALAEFGAENLREDIRVSQPRQCNAVTLKTRVVHLNSRATRCMSACKPMIFT
jgi:hypothetical protein